MSPPSLAATIFPVLISALAAKPLELVCRTAHSREVVEQVLDGTAQAGFVLGTSVPAGLTARRLYQVPIACVAHRDHPAAAARSLRLGDLANYRLAVHSWGPGSSELGELLHSEGIAATRVCWVSPSATALTLAVEHGYVAVLHSDAASAQLRDGVLARVQITGLPRWSLEVAVAYRQGPAQREATMMADILDSAGIADVIAITSTAT